MKMQKKDLSLYHEVLEPVQYTEKPPLLIMLHGYGSHEQDLFSMAPMLNQKFMVVSARAPQRLPWGGYAWYDINFDQLGGKMSDTEQAKTSLKRLEVFYEELKQSYAFDTNRVYLMGFSQGAILSYALSLQHPKWFKGILALSGYILKELIPEKFKPTDHQHLSYFITHGTADEVISVDWGKSATSVLEQLNIKHSYREYPMGHGINPDCFDDVKAYLRQEEVL
jgi:phospholipase/carboxylesterase